MKKLLFFMHCCLVMNLHTNWILQSIYLGKDSSLYVSGAHRIKNGAFKFSYLDKNIKKAVKKPVIILNHRIFTNQINQDALCVVIEDQKDSSVRYELYLDSQSSAAINSDRSKIKKIFDFPMPKEKNSATFDGFYARAVFKQTGQALPLGFAQTQYREADSAFDVVIHHDQDGFNIKLQAPSDM